MLVSAAVIDAAGHARAEIARLVAALAALLREQRARGRTPFGDAVQGLVVEDGEAEGLVLALARTWIDQPRAADAAPRRDPREEITSRASAAVAQGANLPLHEAVRTFALEPFEQDAVVLALAVELDARFGRLVGYLNDHVQRTRPTLGLVAELAAAGGGMRPELFAMLERPLIRDGLVLLEGEGPLPALTVRLAPDLVAHLATGQPRMPRPIEVESSDGGRLGRLVLDAETRRLVQEWAHRVRDGGAPAPLVLAGPPGSGRATLASAAVGAAGRALVRVPIGAENAAPNCLVGRREARFLGHRAAILVETAGEMPWPALAGLDVPIVVSAPEANAESIASSAPREPLVIRLPEPTLGERVRLWKALLPPGDVLDEADLGALAARFRFRPGAMAHVMRRAIAEAAVAPEGARKLTVAHLERACRAVGAASMGPLAQKLPLPYRRSDLIAPPRVDEELDLAVAWIRHQRTVLDDWGFGRRVVQGRGLTALFSGPPGTGKTMAAQVLAREIGVDAFRVDLSRVMSKYIGETEKNLGALFDQASASGGMIFFDEADAIFGKRSEVSDAHDRYANVEIGYLLQRMEEHDGITVLATNRQMDLDEAFIRRFHLIVDFPMPSEADRFRIWKGVFPPEIPMEKALDLATLSREYEMSGGEIRNAALAAGFIAAMESRPLSTAMLHRAVKRELIKSGKVVDAR